MGFFFLNPLQMDFAFSDLIPIGDSKWLGGSGDSELLHPLCPAGGPII